MGLSINCRKGGTTSLDVSVGGFAQLRNLVAKLSGKEFGEHNATLSDGLRIYDSQERKAFYDAFDAKTMELLKRHKVSWGIVDFCVQSDCDGSIGMRSCRMVLRALDSDTSGKDMIIGYAGWEHPARVSDFKELLREGIETRGGIEWH